MSDVTAADLVPGQIIHLDGRAREVLDVAPGNTAGYRYITVDGFNAPLHVGAHWVYTLVTC